MFRPKVVSVSETTLVFYYGTCNFFFKKNGTYTCDNTGYHGPSNWMIEHNQLYFSHSTMMGNWSGWDNKMIDQSGHDECVRLIRAWINDEAEQVLLEE